MRSINGKRLTERIRELGKIGAEDSGGRTRLAATTADKEGRDMVVGWMRETGLRVETDMVGNLFGIWETDQNQGGMPVLLGSHIDTVIHAGQYDGCVGVIAGIEVIAALKESGYDPSVPIAVAVFTNEEGVRYAPDMMGSSVYAGVLSVKEALAAKGTDGTVLGEELDRIGYKGTLTPGFMIPCAYVELHIEQGPVLDTEKIPIGAVENLQGTYWYEVTVEGAANHAGTTPVSMRKDAGLAAAKAIIFLRELCVRSAGKTVATAGYLKLEPNAINVISSRAVFTVDMRNPDEQMLKEEEKKLMEYLYSLEESDGVSVTVRRLARSEPVQFDENIVRMIENAAAGRGLASRRITSGAGQDAQMMAHLCPSAMIFVPSVKGISHNPLEYTREQELIAGANVLLDVTEELSRAKIRVITRKPVSGLELPKDLTIEDACRVQRFHRSIPGYRPTPLTALPDLARRWNIKGIYVKDESKRFGLNAFKGLGSSYAMYRILCEKLEIDPEQADFSCFQQENIRKQTDGITFVTATDGNHGKGVSWAAGLFGCRAYVLMPAGSSEERAQAIRSAGPAIVEITDKNYDETVACAERISKENGWILIQDTAWMNYEQIPLWITQGYLTMGMEAIEELEAHDIRPTHVFLQAGVGSMAGGICGFLMNYYDGEDFRPIVSTVEPDAAPCIYLSALYRDGKAHSVVGNPKTIMAGLNCGTPSRLAWPVLRDFVSGYFSCPDFVTVCGMRTYAGPAGDDPPVVSGESGAVTLGTVRILLEDDSMQAAREALELGPDSVILLFNTEGDTDPVSYKEIVYAQNAPH